MSEAALASDTARLAEFARVFKAAARSVTLYPGGHPSIEMTLGRLAQLTNPPAQVGPLRIGVTPDSLLLDGQPLAKTDAVIGDLAALLHSHLIGELTVLPGGTVAAWREFLMLVERSPDEVRAEGGIAAVWAARGQAHLDIREIDYGEALRERFSGADVTWERVVSNCLRGDTLDIPDELLSAVLDEEAREQAVTDALAAVDQGAGTGAGPASKADILIRLIGGVVRSMAGRPREKVEPVMRDLSTALGRLSPDMLVAVIQRMKQANSGIDSASTAIVEGLVDGMSDTTISDFVARNAVGYSAPVERVVQAFQALVWDGNRRERLLSLAHRQASETQGHTAGFEQRWQDVAQKLMKQYDDRSYVAESYALELNQARAQAVTIEQLKEEPREQIDAWMATVATSELRKLDLALVTDLLTIEKLPEQREPLAQPVLALLKDLLLVGDFEATEHLLTALHEEGANDSLGGPSLRRTVLDRLPIDTITEHLVGHFATIDQSHVEQVKRVCLNLGDQLVQPLTEALAQEDRTRIRERLTETILAFGDVGRQHVERLTSAPDAAVRRTAIYLLRELGVTEDLPEMQDLVHDVDARAQRAAVMAVIRVGTHRGYRMLLQALGAASPSSRESLMLAIGGSRDERTVPLLLHMLEQLDHAGELGWAYERTIELLGHWGHPSAVRALVGVLQQGDWWAPRRTATLRALAAGALANIGTHDAVAALTEASVSGPRGVRKVAAAQLQHATSVRRMKEAR